MAWRIIGSLLMAGIMLVIARDVLLQGMAREWLLTIKILLNCEK
jgi:hypothetical protein